MVFVILLLINACRSSAAPVASPEQPASGAVTTHNPPLARERTGPQQPSGSGNGLVLWAPPFFSINTPDRPDAVLAAVLAESAPAANGAPVKIVTKAEQGQAGLLSYLLITSRVASTLVPDIVLINSLDLSRAVNAGLLVALTPEEAAPFSNIPPPILETATIQGALYGLPFVANLEHLVYQTDRLATPPATWKDFLSQEKRLLFAGGSVDGHSVSFAWTLYLLGGGQLDEQGNILAPSVLESAFELLSDGHKRGLIPDSALTLSSPQAVWTFFVNGGAEMAVSPVSLYLNQQSETGEIGFAPLPTLDGEARSVVTSWSFAVVTQEPERRQRALHLLQQLFAPQVQGEWSWSARQVPTQPDAFAYWNTGDPYTIFLRELLANSVAPPNPHTFDETERILQQTQRDLLAGTISPQQALDNLPLSP